MDPFDIRLWSGFSQGFSNPCVVDQIVIDSRRIDSKDALFVALKGRRHDGHQFVEDSLCRGAKFVIVEEGFKGDVDERQLIRVKKPLKALQEIAASYRNSMDAKVVAICGAVGKTLVKDLLLSFLNKKWRTVASPESFNSQIGVALSLLEISQNDEVALIEAAVSHPGEMNSLVEMIQPSCTILTLVNDIHLKSMGSLELYASELMKLIHRTHHAGWVLAPSDPLLDFQDVKSLRYFWDQPQENLPHATYTTREWSQQMHYQLTFPKEETYQGRISTGFTYFLNLVNMATKAASLMGVSKQVIVEGLKSYSVELMQTEVWRSPYGTTFINHPYGSDPQSVDRALLQLNQAPPHHRKFFVFGGLRGAKKSGDLKRVGHAIASSKVDHLMLFGEHDWGALKGIVNKESPSSQISEHPEYTQAIEKLRPFLKHDDTVLIKGERKTSLKLLTECFQDSISHNQCIVDLTAIDHNIHQLRTHLPEHTRIMVMVKAQGYGTDDVQLAKYLEQCGVDILGVSYVDEAVGLKRAGVKQDVFVLNAAHYEVSKVVSWEMEVGVSDRGFVELLADEAKRAGKRIKVHLHIDTGMSRFGCRESEAVELAKLIEKSPFLSLEGVMTHLSCTDDSSYDKFTKSQLGTFRNVIVSLRQEGINPLWIHAQNSGGAIRFDFPEGNMVRVGVAIFGLSTSKDVKKKLKLKLAVSLLSHIVGINKCQKGDAISYGRSYRVQKDETSIAVLPIGYFDGLHRHYSDKGCVYIRGKKAPMVGKICMDYMMVDITDIPGVSIGDTALFFGRDEYGHFAPPEDFISYGESIIHELVTCLGQRIQRIFIRE